MRPTFLNESLKAFSHKYMLIRISNASNNNSIF